MNGFGVLFQHFAHCSSSQKHAQLVLHEIGSDVLHARMYRRFWRTEYAGPVRTRRRLSRLLSRRYI